MEEIRKPIVEEEDDPFWGPKSFQIPQRPLPPIVQVGKGTIIERHGKRRSSIEGTLKLSMMDVQIVLDMVVTAINVDNLLAAISKSFH